MTQRVFFHILVIVLCFQIATLEPAFNIFQVVAAGETKTIVKETLTQTREAVAQAVLQSAETNSTDVVVFTGDVMLGRDVETKMLLEGADYPYRKISFSEIVGNPLVVGNFEASMKLPHTQTPAFGMKFSVSSDKLKELKKSGFTHLSLANNHSLDYGQIGYQNAVSLLEDSNLETFGHNNVLSKNSISYLETDKGRIAIIGINATQQAIDPLQLESVMKRAVRTSSFQVAYIHWGNEYEKTHSQEQRLLAERLIDEGADLIVGHHPHVIQDIDVIDGVLVFYSLGNFIFDQYFSVDVEQGLVLAFDLKNEPLVSIYPVTSEATPAQPALMDQTKASLLLKDLAARSHPSLQTYIMEGNIPLYQNVATSTKMAMMFP